MSAFWFALAFLTRVPTPALDSSNREAQARALAWYPLVGAMIGGLLSLLAWAATSLAVPPLLTAALLLALWVGISGGLHLDGLADCADAWAGGHGDRERTLRILKDPAAGPMGVVALVLVLLLKFAALASLPPQAWQWLWLLPALGRAAAVALFLTLPYVRAGGLGIELAQAPRRPASFAVALSAVLALLFGLPGLALLAASLAVFLLWRADCQRRLQGFTGDAAGAVIERVETAALVAACVVGAWVG
jgi:adenosylcobinamide-GDP ribazoletransferase